MNTLINLEQPYNNLIKMLSKYQCLDLFNCNPKQYVFQIKDQ